jgi:CMP-N-acetylneuraminic acid synthetase
MPKPIFAFVPCRAGSQRVPLKNTRPFGRYSDGLVGVKLRQILACSEVDGVVVSTDDPVVIHISEALRAREPERISIVPRPPELAISDSLDKFLAYVPSIMPDCVVAWTHVTSPFFGEAEWRSAISAYRREVDNGQHDSMMSVTTIQSYIWDANGCISHDRDAVKWPQTQDLRKIYEVNSALFMMDRDAMLQTRDRVGSAPFLFEVDSIAGFDIDWPDQFEMAERLSQVLL